MSQYEHRVLCVTSWDKEIINSALKRAVKMFPRTVIGLVNSEVNSYYSLFIGTSGYKADTDGEERYNTQLDRYVKFLETFAHSDNTTNLDYGFLTYGEKEG